MSYLEYDADELGTDEGQRITDMLTERDLLIAELLGMVIEGSERDGIIERQEVELDLAAARIEELSTSARREAA